MTHPALDWSRIRFVVFDVDGTLYAQAPLRVRMAAELALHTVHSLSPSTARILSIYRSQREVMADEAVENFETVLLEKSSRMCGCSRARIDSVVSEWIEHRPLRHIGKFTYPHLADLFEKIRMSGREIGILSDYPAQEKLAAMGLAADHVVHAAEVGVLKPDPRGLQHLMEKAGCLPNETIMVGDRFERDGLAALRANVTPLIRSRKPLPECLTFERYDDDLFKYLTPVAPRPASQAV